MPLRLDRIVIAVHDLDTAIADYGELGFDVRRPWSDAGRDMCGALVPLADGACLELVAWTAPAPLARWWRMLQEHGEGAIDVALSPSISGADLRRRGGLHHPNGALGIASVALAVPDLEPVLARYRALLDPGVQQNGTTPIGSSFEVRGAGLRMAVVQLGATALVLSAPAQVRQRAGRGWTGVHGLVLRVAGLAERAQPPLSLAHGVHIDYEPCLVATPRAPRFRSTDRWDGVGG